MGPRYIIDLLKNYGNVFIFEFKFNNPNNEFILDDYYFENTSEDIFGYMKQNEILKPIVICFDHASPYGLYAVNKKPELFSGIICYPLRLYIKASPDRRIWKFKDRGGWEKYISKKYDIDNYYLNPTNISIKTLLKNPQKEELEVLYFISDKILQAQAENIPKEYLIPTILFTRLDMDVESIVKLNYERKAIADMKGIINENDALYTSMMWNFDRVKYDKNLLELNKNNDNLRIRYYIAGLEDDRNITDSILILSKLTE